MLIGLFRKYFAIIFLLSLFLSTTHHHDDLSMHSDCQVCVIQSQLSNIDTPPQNTYLVDVTLVFDTTRYYETIAYLKSTINPLHLRAPPFLS